jgi:c-di-GMP-binding flagellar brake protein YcgR
LVKITFILHIIASSKDFFSLFFFKRPTPNNVRYNKKRSFYDHRIPLIKTSKTFLFLNV